MVIMMSIAVILDTSALLRAYRYIMSDEIYYLLGTDRVFFYMPPSVIDEVKSQRFMVSFLSLKPKITVMEPSSQAVSVVKKEAEKMGYLGDLSDVDIDVVALAVDLTHRYESAIVMTSDMAIQNICRVLNIDVLSVGKKIKYVARRMKKCLNCGMTYSASLDKCPNCASNNYRILVRRVK